MICSICVWLFIAWYNQVKCDCVSTRAQQSRFHLNLQFQLKFFSLFYLNHYSIPIPNYKCFPFNCKFFEIIPQSFFFFFISWLNRNLFIFLFISVKIDRRFYFKHFECSLFFSNRKLKWIHSFKWVAQNWFNYIIYPIEINRKFQVDLIARIEMKYIGLKLKMST